MNILLRAACFFVVLLGISQARAESLTPIKLGVHRFDVKIADTPEEQRQGLMFRREMPLHEGMLFLFSPPQPISMWMKNTYIPLDMVFVDAGGKISHIAANATPLDETPIPSGGEVAAVVELNAGVAEKLGIKVGDAAVFSGVK